MVYLQYHNCDVEGLPLGKPHLGATKLGIHTRRPSARKATGRVFLIAGIASPRHYYLWSTFEVDRVDEVKGEFHVMGTGWELKPPQPLKGHSFEVFRQQCANFVGFRSIDGLPFVKYLERLANACRPPGDAGEVQRFLEGLLELLPQESPHRADLMRAVADERGVRQPTRALSIRQPHAEAIMRGVKKIEYRSASTHIRERIHIYATLGRYTCDQEADMMGKYGIGDVACDALPRGVLVGTVELYDCNVGEWHLRNPQRAEKLLKPKKNPQPVWFYPF
jgi:hypothetical protein